MQAVLHGVGRDVLGVLHAVDPADLVAVVGRDRHLDDPLAGLDHLQDDLGVEVEVVAVGGKGDLGEGVDGIRAVAAVPLGQIGPGHGVLPLGENPVADELVERHAAAAGPALVEHARAEHHVGLAGLDRPDDVGEHLGRVLPVAVEQDHDVEPGLDGPAVARLLIAPVAEVLVLAHGGDVQILGELLVAESDEMGGVVAGIVADQHFGDPTPEVRRNAVEHCRKGRRRVVGDHEDADLHHAGPNVTGQGRCRGGGVPGLEGARQ